MNMKGSASQLIGKMHNFVKRPPLPFKHRRESVNRQLVSPSLSEYISSVRTCIDSSFPQKQHEGDASLYPKIDLQSSVSLRPLPRISQWGTPNTSDTTKNNLTQKYNPLSLRLPYILQSEMNFFKTKWAKYDRVFGAGPSFMDQVTVREKHFNFLRQYNLLYLDLLEAINGSDEATVRIKSKLTTHEMYKEAGINTEDLLQEEGKDCTSEDFRQSCLAYLAIHVLRSPESVISTEARVAALKLLCGFGLKAITSSFSNPHYFKGFELTSPEATGKGQEYVRDLIPRSFLTRSEKRQRRPHNDLFVSNDRVIQLFNTHGYDSYYHMDFDSGRERQLKENNPAETVQVLLSLLRIPHFKADTKEAIFRALMDLTKLDPAQKSKFFGPMASYRADPLHDEPWFTKQGLKDRVHLLATRATLLKPKKPQDKGLQTLKSDLHL